MSGRETVGDYPDRQNPNWRSTCCARLGEPVEIVVPTRCSVSRHDQDDGCRPAAQMASRIIDDGCLPEAATTRYQQTPWRTSG